MSRAPQTHRLKIWPAYFRLMRSGAKTFEYRRYDRDYQVGDTLKLEEWNPDTGAYTGAWLEVQVTLVVTHCPGLPEDYCIMQTDLVDIGHADESSAGREG